MHEELKGLIVPVLTPFKASGAIDEHAFIRHLEFLAHHGVRRIMVNGTTGEFHSLLAKERKMLLKLARRHFPGFIEYFRALEAESEVPFILYNFPKHSGNPITPEILKAVPHAALKDSAQNLELMELYAAIEILLAGPRIEEAAMMQEEVRAYSSPFSAGGVPLLKQALARMLPDYPVNVRPPLCSRDP